MQRSGAVREDFRGALVVLAALGAAALLWIDVPLCPAAALFGLPCPGCGLTRATVALLRGDTQTAFALHPLVFVAVPALLSMGVAAAVRVLGWRGLPAVSTRWVALGAALLVALLFAVWVARWFGAFGGPVPVDGPIWMRFTR